MNTSTYIPEDCVAPILIKDEAHAMYPFFSGTGFFARFHPYESIFFITGKHCTLKPDGSTRGQLQIKYSTSPKCDRAVQFKEYMLTQISSDDDEYEDLIIYVIDELPMELKEEVTNRALRLPDQSIAELLHNNLLSLKGKVRTIGFPSVSKEIDYESNHATVQPRGIVGRVVSCSSDKRWFSVDSLNWTDGVIDGFSGSPVLELVPAKGGVLALPIGILLTGSKSLFRFLSINVATDLIAAYLTKSAGLKRHEVL